MYSFLTNAGRDFLPTISDRPVRCRLGNGGYHEWGGIRAGEKPVKLGEIDPWIRAALRVNSFAPLRVDETADIVVVFQWGCMRPEAGWRGRGAVNSILNYEDMLDLVGGRVLENTNDRTLRQAIIEAALEERYFLIVSAFEPSSYARNTSVLLWRTQISMPSPGVNQSEAFPILAAAGAALYGRETDMPRFVSIDVGKTLRTIARSNVP